MKRKERQKRRISLALMIVLCLAGVYGAGQTGILQAEPVSDSAHATVSVPMEQFYQDSPVKLPDAEGPLERMEQSRITVLLERCKTEKRNSFKGAGEFAGAAIENFRQFTGICDRVDDIGTAFPGNQSRIISYIHDKDGQKGNTISSSDDFVRRIKDERMVALCYRIYL